MSQLDALLERSRAPGTFVEKRAFTLARSKAIEKMREFSLRDPDQAVLELVQAAVFAGARWIAVDTSTEALTVAWVGGKTIQRGELEEIFDYLFADQGRADTRYLMQTAIGVNALLQRKTRRIRIESGDGSAGGTARLDLDKSGKGDVGVSGTGLAGTYLYCERGGGWLDRMTGSDPSPRQASLVEERCLYTPIPILLNGSAPFGYRSSTNVQLFGVKRVAAVSGNERRGALGLPQTGVEPGIRIVVGGVWIATRKPRELGPGLVGVLGDDRLRKTADMADIVEDARWVDLLHDVQPIATQLLRTVHGSSYAPPRLPPRVIEAETPDAIVAEPNLEPLPEAIPQITPREPVALATLAQMNQDDPLFWAEEDVVEGLVRPCDPVRFPYRVLVITPGQARTVEKTLGEDGPRLSRLTNPEDVSFVQHAMERRHGVRSVRVEAEVHLLGEANPRVMPLTLRLHTGGMAPQWDTSKGTGRVPLALVRRDRTETCARLDLPLQHVSVVADLTDVPVELGGRLLTALRHAVQREAWRLLPQDTHADDPWRRRLELALLAEHARPHLVRDPSGAAHVRPRFPAAWLPVAAQLLEAPLAPLRDGTPLTLSLLAELQGTGRVVRLADPADRSVVEPLEARFGYGHVLVPADLQQPLAAVGRRVESWRPLSMADLGDPSVDELILVFAAFEEPAPPEGWTALERLGPGIARWIRSGEGSRPGAVADGAVAMVSLLIAQGHGDWQTRPEGMSADRARSLGSLASMRLAAVGKRLGDVGLRDTGGRARPLSGWLSDPGLRLVARGGASTDEVGVVPVTLDELTLLEQLHARSHSTRLHLLLDDHPELWDDALEGEGWLVTLPVRHAGLRGWLGLRAPFDPTPGVLLEAGDSLTVLPGFTARVPCHGLLHLTGAAELSRAQSELLHFSGMQLYQQLLRRLDADLPEPALRAARAYATRFAQRAHARQGSLGPGLARNLAARVPVDLPDGSPWGTVLDWLEADPETRPVAPDGADATPPHLRTGEVAHLEEAKDLYGFITGPLQRALSAQLPGVRCSASEDAQRPVMQLGHLSDASHCRLTLRRSPLVEQAIQGDPHARGVLLIEACRLAIAWAGRVQHPIDPLAAQQAVLATRLVS